MHAVVAVVPILAGVIPGVIVVLSIIILIVVCFRLKRSKEVKEKNVYVSLLAQRVDPESNWTRMLHLLKPNAISFT